MTKNRHLVACSIDAIDFPQVSYLETNGTKTFVFIRIEPKGCWSSVYMAANIKISLMVYISHCTAKVRIWDGAA